MTLPWHFHGTSMALPPFTQGLYAFGDLKQMTSGFAKKELEANCGTESGDWCVMTTTLENGKFCYGLAHRRGSACHTYIATHGTTKRGRDQAHKDDCDESGHAGPPRKCPKILNDWTQAQPMCDRNNMYRQFELAIEERFPTHSFPFRLQTTVIVGMSIASAYTMYQHFVSKTQFSTFREFVEDVAYDGMLNSWDADHEPVRAGATDATPAARPPREPAPFSIPTESHTSAAFTPGVHELVPISSIPGWTGGLQQRCSICKANARAVPLTGYCCGGCSSAVSIVPIHHTCKVTTCLAKHRRGPALNTGYS